MQAGPFDEGEHPTYALWVHDVLLVHKGLGLMQTEPLGVVGPEGAAEEVDTEAVKRLSETR